MKHEWSYQEGPTPRQCRHCGGTDEKQRCVLRPKGQKADDGRRCIGCPATNPEFVVMPSGELARVCVGCAQAKSYWIYAGSPEQRADPIELHSTLELAVRGVEAIVRRGHLTAVSIWDVAQHGPVARALDEEEVKACRKLGLRYGFDDDDETKHQCRHLCWPGFRGAALCKSRRLWFTCPIDKADRPVLDCEECLGQWLGAICVNQGNTSWIVANLYEATGQLAEQHANLFAVFTAASDLLWTLENPEDAKGVPHCSDPEVVRSRLAAALNNVGVSPESPLRQRQLERVLAGAIGALPRCYRCKKEGKEPIEIATQQSLDAAGDPMYTCDAHSRPGGFDDTGPFPLSWAKWVRQAKDLLGDRSP